MISGSSIGSLIACDAIAFWMLCSTTFRSVSLGRCSGVLLSIVFMWSSECFSSCEEEREPSEAGGKES